MRDTEFDTTWDINKYRYHNEIPHLWELKKKFMLFHKYDYPEERLVCLAHIFCNIHHLGCRYEDEVMDLIEQLTQGMTERNEKFNSRSFALASSAVEAKVKAFMGQSKSSDVNIVRRTTEPISFVRANESDRTGRDLTWNHEGRPTFKRPVECENGSPPKAGRFKYDERPWSGNGSNSETSTEQRDTSRRPESGEERPAQQLPKLISLETKLAAALVKEVVESGPFGKVVVFMSTIHNDSPVSVIERAASAAYMRTSFDYTTEGDKTTCYFCLDGIYVSSGAGRNQKVAKEAACQLALERLKETSFTVEVKVPYVAGDRVERDLEGSGDSQSGGKPGIETPLAESNIGSKMLKLMGWAGGGLGKNEQGIEEPIKPYDQNVKRGGLGITNFSDFRKKITRIIEDYAVSDNKNDLVFAPDFSKNERKTIHDLVRRYNLKSRSYGKNEDIRHIVVFKKIQPLEIVEDLLTCGGETQKYKLIPPNPKVK